ncbi:histidine phosphatase family protein [Prochlorococcus sp. MIT 1341]|uniref:histidine phosphatase family protein n=1 Tax=Prochlorococcus sp. MIT 1341 TaxID=3096221 RepID=UPI002A750BE4|nr:histidine phosphatase family protein [Prochlorococcus sp. MIT 1341]
MRLLLVRHGLSSFNSQGRIQGRDDLSILTQEGVVQAQKTGKALTDMEIEAFYSSPLRRAAQTAKELIQAKGSSKNPIFDNDLLEIDLSPWSGLTGEEVQNTFPNDFKVWKTQPQDLVLTRGQSDHFKPLQELMKQANCFLKKLIKQHSIEGKETILVVAHNAILRCLILNLIGNPSKDFRRLKLDNASVSVLNILSYQKNTFHSQIECLNNTVHLNPPIPPSKSHSRLILVRHGETNWNQQGRFQGQIDIPLNENGFKQAFDAGLFLNKIKLHKAYSSSMTRPTQTAKEILKSHKNLKLTLENELKEINHGLWEGKLEAEIAMEWPELLAQWKKSPEKVVMPEGESIHQVWERSVKCLRKISRGLSQGETALVVAHDAVNKTIICHALGLNASNIWMVKQGNGGVTVLDIPKDSNQPMVVTCMNLTSHLGGILDKTAAGAL